ncbi:MAG: hypothetical protein ABIL58_26495 [Pseudomonadota bacterium]
MELRYKHDEFATHQPVLVELLKRTSGDIIELGCGLGSTALIKELTGDRRRLVSVESDYQWYSKFKHLETAHHQLYYLNAGNEDCAKTGEKWAAFLEGILFGESGFEVALIDQSPWTARTHCLNLLKNRVPYIIVHDVDYFPNAGAWGTIRSSTRQGALIRHDMDFSDIVTAYQVYYPPFRFFRCPTGPPTLLCSNFVSTEALQLHVEDYYR